MTTEELLKLENDLWAESNNLRANSDLKSNEYATPVLGLIFLKFADNKYSLVEEEIKKELEEQKNSRLQRSEIEIAIEKCGFYLPENARYNYLLELSDEENRAEKIREAMTAIEKHREELNGVLPKDEYFRLNNKLLESLLRTFSDIPKGASGDVFGKIYEFFLGKFALAEGQGGGEFFTPTSVVKYMVEVIEPYRGAIYDPACGSGGMFVQSCKFIKRRKEELHDSAPLDLYVYGQEKTLDTVKLAKMNLVVNGLRGEIKQANTYYDDPFDSYGKFDYVMANPPFNVKDVILEDIENDKRFNEYGLPRNKSKSKKKEESVPNANYLWINLFTTSLKKDGKAALVMPNSASDARHSEQDIRIKLISNGLISQMVTLPSNMFNTVTLPATLWFFDKGREKKDEILFIDARNIYKQIDRSRREFTEAQIQNLATITRLYKGENNRFIELIDQYFENSYNNVQTLEENLNEVQNSLNELYTSFEIWYQNSKSSFDNVKLNKINEIQFEETLNILNIIDVKYVIEIVKEIQFEFDKYKKNFNIEDINTSNKIQNELRVTYEDMNKKLKALYKDINKSFRKLEELYNFANKELKKDNKEFKEIYSTKNVKERIDILKENIDDVKYFISQIHWLHERFPEVKYEDVTGLCKVASIEEIKEQDYSLNPGRYVGVVIEEDGMTEEEFTKEMLYLNDELKNLNESAKKLEKVIAENIEVLVKIDEEE